MRDLSDLTASIVAPGVHLVPSDAPSRSHWGGAPGLPAGDWPTRNGRKLTFLARVSLAELHRAHRIGWLPTTGALLFFYDLEEQPWGFDPKDKGSGAVLHVPDLDSPITPVKSKDGGGIAPRSMSFRLIQTLPSWEREAVQELTLSDDEFDEYSDLAEAPYDGHARHQVGGLPVPVQGDQMELECQLASNGIYIGDPSGYADPRARPLEAGAAEWRLLLQFDTDDDLGVMWGDCGRLYFWVRESEAKAGRFGGTWLILQSG